VTTLSSAGWVVKADGSLCRHEEKTRSHHLCPNSRSMTLTGPSIKRLCPSFRRWFYLKKQNQPQKNQMAAAAAQYSAIHPNEQVFSHRAVHSIRWYRFRPHQKSRTTAVFEIHHTSAIAKITKCLIYRFYHFPLLWSKLCAAASKDALNPAKMT
jgi:hypothetical protein